ncbi:hypothetical protein L6164_026938 [Bauhinia variegata]|uniref:Uncharacterized protein n=1 Tax=Bauhinia variegata TaxID=167791 RepID=A0ACB9LRP5_BAUVA|nr:hypothetical protein L6164_026938 [Bauhinia variegata]
MAASTQYRFPLTAAAISSSKADKRLPPIHVICSSSYSCHAFTGSKLNPSIRVLRSKIFRAEAAPPKLARLVFRVRGSVEDNSVASPEPESDNSEAGATIDLRLPRRSLLVQFTCNSCGEKTKRLINRLAYERGVVFVQCAGCLRHHKLVDNLGLITEYDFREETSMESEIDQV